MTLYGCIRSARSVLRFGSAKGRGLRLLPPTVPISGLAERLGWHDSGVEGSRRAEQASLRGSAHNQSPEIKIKAGNYTRGNKAALCFSLNTLALRRWGMTQIGSSPGSLTPEC